MQIEMGGMPCASFDSALPCLCFSAPPPPAAAQEKFPNRPVKFVVSFAAGGSNDIIARVLCEWLSEHFGQQFIVENRPGGSGNVGAALRAQLRARRLHA